MDGNELEAVLRQSIERNEEIIKGAIGHARDCARAFLENLETIEKKGGSLRMAVGELDALAIEINGDLDNVRAVGNQNQAWKTALDLLKGKED